MEDNVFLDLFWEFLGMAILFSPIFLTLWILAFFNLLKKEEYSTKRIKIYVFLTLLSSWAVYVLYGLVFIDPELMLTYPLWIAPQVIVLFIGCMKLKDFGTKLDSIFAYVGILIAVLALILPFLFIQLRGYGIV